MFASYSPKATRATDLEGLASVRERVFRGCIVAMDLSVLALSVVKKGDEDIPGLTDRVEPKRLGPKRATKIRKFFGLSKDDDVS